MHRGQTTIEKTLGTKTTEDCLTELDPVEKRATKPGETPKGFSKEVTTESK
ncbi:MAG: hypothetical protein WA414_11055 [Acidobacteriaceae bacterium]